MAVGSLQIGGTRPRHSSTGADPTIPGQTAAVGAIANLEIAASPPSTASGVCSPEEHLGVAGSFPNLAYRASIPCSVATGVFSRDRYLKEAATSEII